MFNLEKQQLFVWCLGGHEWWWQWMLQWECWRVESIKGVKVAKKHKTVTFMCLSESVVFLNL